MPAIRHAILCPTWHSENLPVQVSAEPKLGAQLQGLNSCNIGVVVMSNFYETREPKNTRISEWRADPHFGQDFGKATQEDTSQGNNHKQLYTNMLTSPVMLQHHHHRFKFTTLPPLFALYFILG